MEYVVNFTWDDEADVWIAQSDDIPGLVLEGGSLDALIERVRYAVPELLELNKTEKQSNLPKLTESFPCKSAKFFMAVFQAYSKNNIEICKKQEIGKIPSIFPTEI